MPWIYFSIPIFSIVGVYLVWDRKRLGLFRKLNGISNDPTRMVKVAMSVSQLAKLTRSTISHTIDTGNTLLFEYKTVIFMATPLDKDTALVSKVSDQSTIQKYRASKTA
jgi:hypothetical protein